MSTSGIPVEPSLSIGAAATMAQDQQQDWLSFPLHGTVLVAHRNDLDKMVSMGLENLPIESIGVPESSPLVKNRDRLVTQGDYARRLSSFFPVYFVAALYELQSLMQRQGIKGYVIGGITRDLLQFQEKRLTVQDVDITVEGDALALASFLMENSRNFELIDEFPEFGTAKVRYKDNLMFDFASTRQEIYPHCGALPVVVKRGVALGDDVVRRDFTINALAFSVHELGQVLDYSNGIQDIQDERIRILHAVSFFEDPSRILRALKFCARFDFELSGGTEQLLMQFLHWGGDYYKGGGERIKQELKAFFSVEESSAKSRWLAFFLEKGCHRLIRMETRWQADAITQERFREVARLLPEVASALSAYIDRDFAFDTYLCFLFRDWAADEFQQASLRLGLTKNERDTVEHFRRIKESTQARFGSLHEFSAPADIYDLFHGLPFITIVACLIELGIQNEKHMKTVLEAFLKYKRKWEKMELELDGNDLMGMGIPKGKIIGQLLDQLLHAKLAGQVPDRLDEVRFVQNQMEALAPADESIATQVDVSSETPPPEKPTGIAPNGVSLEVLPGGASRPQEGATTSHVVPPSP